jgi:hypothetical protein
MTDHDKLTKAYLAQFGAVDRDENLWASEEIDELIEVDPDTVWELLLLMIEAAPSEGHLDWLAAAPLEGLILKYGDRFRARIEKTFDDDLKFRMCMAHVIIPEADPFVLDLIERALDESYPSPDHQSTKET